MSRLNKSVGVLVLACGAGTGRRRMIEEWEPTVVSPSEYDRHPPACVTGETPGLLPKCPTRQVRTIGVPLGVISDACAGTGISSLAARACSGCPSSNGMIRRSQRRIIVTNDFAISASNTVPALSST